MRRRTLLAAIVTAAAATVLPIAVGAAAGAGVLDVRAWRWTSLPGTGGLEVWSNVAVRVTWTEQGGVTAGPLAILAPPVAGGRIETMGGGRGLAVRRPA